MKKNKRTAAAGRRAKFGKNKPASRRGPVRGKQFKKPGMVKMTVQAGATEPSRASWRNPKATVSGPAGGPQTSSVEVPSGSSVDPKESSTEPLSRKAGSAPAAASRAPRRVVIDRAGPAETVVAVLPGDRAADSAKKEPPVQDAPAQNQVEQAPLPRIGWSALPGSVPQYLRVFAVLCARECERASAWPFSFARLIAMLPKLLSGYEFLILALRTEHEDLFVAHMLGLDVLSIAKAGMQGSQALQDKFSEICTDMERQWSVMLSGAGADEKSLIERYLVEGIDRGIQKLTAAMLLRALGAKNPVVNGEAIPGKWTINPRWVN